MKKLLILLYAGLFSTLPACETILPVDIPEGEEWGITLNAVASPDTTFYAYVTHCYANPDAPNYAFYEQIIDNQLRTPASFEDYYHSQIYGHVADIPDAEEYPFPDSKKSYNIIKESTLTDAKVELTVNDETIYPMEYDTLTLSYQSNYIPAIGDRLEVRIKNAAGEQTVARTEVPRAQKIEVVEMNVELLEDRAEIEELLQEYKGYVRMKLRLHDPIGEKNYYRLAVRGLYSLFGTYYNIWDFYLSSDPIFKDERLTSKWGAWPAFFSDVFDDSLINGESYEFDIKTYILGYVNDKSSPWPIYFVSLQSISEDYYHYLKSMQLYRISREDTYSEGVYIHSNNEGGWGILGGISGETLRIDPFKDKNQ